MAETLKTAAATIVQPPALVAARSKAPATVGELLSRDEETQRALKAVATDHLKPDRALRLAINAVRRNPRLAQCDPVSFMGALMTATGLGLEPNTVLQHAFLIPYKQRKPRRDSNNRILTGDDGRWLMDEYYECQFQVGYRGFIALMYRTGYIKEVSAEAIYEGDRFSHRKGTVTELSYEKSLERPEGARLLGAFCYTKLGEHGQSYTVLPAEDIYKIRGRSETFRTLTRAVEAAGDEKKRLGAEAKLAETPWVLWEDAMAAKTAIKQHAKQHDLGVHVALASDIDGLGDAGTIDLSPMANPEYARSVMIDHDEVVEATGTQEDGEDGAAQPAQTGSEGQGAPGKAQPPQQQQQQQQPEPTAQVAPAVASAPRQQREMEGNSLFKE